MDQTTDAGSMSEMPSVPTKELAGSVGDIKPLPAQHSSRRRDFVAPLDRREAHLSIEDNNFSASKAIGAPLLSSDPTPFSTKLNIPTLMNNPTPFSTWWHIPTLWNHPLLSDRR